MSRIVAIPAMHGRNHIHLDKVKFLKPRGDLLAAIKGLPGTKTTLTCNGWVVHFSVVNTVERAAARLGMTVEYQSGIDEYGWWLAEIRSKAEKGAIKREWACLHQKPTCPICWEDIYGQGLVVAATMRSRD